MNPMTHLEVSMDVPFFSSKQDPQQTESPLSTPEELVPGFFHCPSQDLVLFTRDADRRFTYMSPSAANVFEVDFQRWRNKNYELLLTNHEWNSHYLSIPDEEIPAGDVQILKCEIHGDSGNRIQLEVRRKAVVVNGEFVGVVGISRRLRPEETALSILCRLVTGSDDPTPLVARWEALSQSERDVVELVVEGEMNKMIAKKLNIAERTVESRRSKVMKKLGLRSVPDLVRFHLVVQQWAKSQADASPMTDPTPILNSVNTEAMFSKASSATSVVGSV